MITKASEQIFQQANANVNKAFFGNILFNVKAYGAKGDGVTDDTVAIQSAVALCKTNGSRLYFPSGKYLINSPILIDYSLVIEGNGPNNSQLITKSNIAILQYDLSVNSIYYGGIKGIGFVDNNTGIRTSVAGIQVSGVASTYFNTNSFKNLGFYGTYYCIRFNKSGNIGGENRHDWNIFDDIFTGGSGSNGVQYGIKFENGSGTGNIFTNFRLGAASACLMWGGGQDVNIGDIVISNIQFSGSLTAIKMTKGATSYGERIAINNCQWDAGILHGLDFNGMGVFTVRGCNWGGGTDAILIGCYSYTIDGFQIYESKMGTLVKQNFAAGATIDLFSLAFPNTFQSAFIEIVSWGIMQGIGARIITTRVHVSWDGTGATIATLDNFATGTAGNQLTHVITGGATPKISCTTVGTAAGSDIRSEIRIIADKYAISRL